MRIFFAFIIAPAAPGLLLWKMNGNEYGLIMVAVAYFFTIAFGSWIYIYFNKRHWLSWWQVTLAGLIIGVVGLPTVILLMTLSHPSLNDAKDAALLGGIYGSVAGFAFWLIGLAKMRRLGK